MARDSIGPFGLRRSLATWLASALVFFALSAGYVAYEHAELRRSVAGDRSAEDRVALNETIGRLQSRAFAAGSAVLAAILSVGAIAFVGIRAKDRKPSAAEAPKADLETAKLIEASELLEVMLENIPDIIYFKDRDSRFVRFSNALMRRLGISNPSELYGKSDADVFTAEHAKPALEDEQGIIRSGVPVVGKLERETYSDGRACWVLTTKMPWRNREGVIVGTFGISKDVTELKETEKALAYERDQLRALLDTCPEMIYFKDEQSRFVLTSRSKVLQVLKSVPDLRERRTAKGLSPDVIETELLTGMTDFDTYGTEDAKRAFEDEQEIIRSGKTMGGKLEKQSYANGQVQWSLSSKMPWRGKDGRTIGTFGISKDITELKEVEQKMAALHHQLMETSRQAGMAEVATGVLHNVGNVLNSVNVSATLVADQVRRTKALNISKISELFEQNKANLAHFMTEDSRGKMIPAYVATLAESLASEHKSMVEELDSLKKNVDHIKEIVAMQQTYAKTSGVTELVSVTDMVEDALRINAGSLARHEVDVVRDYQVRPVVTTDKHKVMQILINVVRNAKYACDESGRPDKVITVRTRDGGRSVRIEIADNGVGIPSDNLTRIFEHGFTTRSTGHGFGLHSGALAAKELGGELKVVSEGVGRGATFALVLPLTPESDRSGEAPA